MAYFNAPYRPADLTLNSDAINNSCVGFWALTDGVGSSAVDVSTGGNDGTMSSSHVAWKSSEIGTTANFDGDLGTGYFDISTDLSRNQTAFSCSAWIKPDSVSYDDFIFYESNSVNVHQTRFGLRLGGGGRVQCVGRDDDGDSFTTFANSNAGLVSTGTWQHVVAVFDPTGSGCKVFLDGVDVTASSDNTGDGFPNTASLAAFIGSINHGSYNFNGKISNVRVFNAALTQGQVEQLYTRPWTGTNYDTEALWLSPPASPVISSAPEATSLMSSCVSWWPLVKGSGTVATDLVGSNDGTITNGAWAAETVGNVADLGTTSNVSGTGVNVSSAVTFSLWYKEAGSTASGPIFLSLPRSTGGANGVDLQHRGTGVRFGVYTSSGSRVTATSGAVDIGDGEWHHIAGTYDGSSIRLYLDGVERASASQTGTVSQLANGEFNINALASGVSGFSADGFYQNVRIFSSALTADQIRLLHARPFIGAEYNETAPLYPPVPSSLTPLDSGNSILTNLEGWWPLTETDNFASGAADIGGNSNTGTKSGGVTSEFSEVGTAANFDNTGHIDVGKSFWDSGIVSANAFTFNAWFNVDNNTADHGIFGSWNSAQEALNIWVDVGGSNVSLTAICGDGSTQAITSVTAPVVTIGQWHMGTVIFDGSANTLKVYLDSVYSNQNSSATATLTTAPMGFHIGDDGSGSRTMEGLIQNCRLWSRVLTDTEVANIFYSPWLGSAYPSTSTGAPRFLINGLRPLLVNGGLVR